MLRVFISFGLLVLIVFSSIGGCSNGGNDNGMEPEPSPGPTDIPVPEPTPEPTLKPTPEPGDGFGCDFVPNEEGGFYTQSDCSGLAFAFDCESFSFQGGICEVFSCEECLCDATSMVTEGVLNAEGCSLASFISNCFNAFFDDTNEGFNLCHLFVCVHEAHCGPFDVLVP